MRLLAGALALSLLACRAEGEGNAQAIEPAKARPTLHVITGLPLFFGEGFDLDAEKSPTLARLEQDFEVVPVDGPEQLPAHALLLAAQPRAMTAGRLVVLDKWVRDGGRLLLLADPWLTWPSELPLGHPERPPVQFADTGLLRHWGLSLEPERMPATESVERQFGGRSPPISAPGRITAAGTACAVQADGFVARCRLGRGAAVIIADADFLRMPIADEREALAAELHGLSPR